MKLYPAMLNISGKRAVVIGGGNVALRKVRDLIECGASVTVIAPEIHDDIAGFTASHHGSIEIIRRKYKPGDLDGALLVFSAADDETTNAEVFQEADGLNLLINAVDDPPHCTFFVPSWFRREDLIVSVSTSGVSPSLAARLRRDIEKTIPDSIEDMLAALHHIRILLREDNAFKGFSSEKRGQILKKIVDNNTMLDDCVTSYKNGSLESFIKKISNV